MKKIVLALMLLVSIWTFGQGGKDGNNTPQDSIKVTTTQWTILQPFLYKTTFENVDVETIECIGDNLIDPKISSKTVYAEYGVIIWECKDLHLSDASKKIGKITQKCVENAGS